MDHIKWILPKISTTIPAIYIFTVNMIHIWKSNYRSQSDFQNEKKERTWLVSSVRIVTSSIKKTLGKSVRFATNVSEDGANDWIKAGCFNHSFELYEPLYPYFFSISTNLSSNFFPSDHLTCCTIGRDVGYIVCWWI